MRVEYTALGKREKRGASAPPLPLQPRPLKPRFIGPAAAQPPERPPLSKPLAGVPPALLPRPLWPGANHEWPPRGGWPLFWPWKLGCGRFLLATSAEPVTQPSLRTGLGRTAGRGLGAVALLASSAAAARALTTMSLANCLTESARAVYPSSVGWTGSVPHNSRAWSMSMSGPVIPRAGSGLKM